MRQSFKIISSPLCFLICLLFVMVLIILMDSVYIPKHTRPIPQHLTTTSLLNLSHFKYIINNDVCGTSIDSEYIKAVLIITSHAGNIHIRRAHRIAVPKSTLLSVGVRRVFLLAVARENIHVEPYKTIQQKEVVEENILYGDLIQGNFNEAYRNLSYKHVMGLQWVSKFCKEAQYIIKMDDDIILDIYQLLKILPKEADVSKPFLLGYILKGMKPVRDNKSKWFVTQTEYPKAFYPPFLSGWMYVTTPAVATEIINSAAKANKYNTVRPYQSFFWIDDVYVTGILAQQTGAQLIDFSKYFAVHPQYFQCCVEAAIIQRSGKKSKEHEPYSCEFVVGPSGGDMQLLLQVLKEAGNCWRETKQCQRQSNHTEKAKKCIVGRSEAFDWIRRPPGKGQASYETVIL